MLTRHQLLLAAEWIFPSPNAFWQWDKEGEALVHRKGRTVVFREELGLIVERFADRGLPPSEPLMLILAGCRGATLQPTPDWDIIFDGEDGEFFRPVLERLASLAILPPALIEGPAGRANLARHIFANVPPVTADQTEAVLAFFRAKLPIRSLSRPEHSAQHRTWRKNFDILRAPLQKLDPLVLQCRRKTGVDAPPEAAPVELPDLKDGTSQFPRLEDDPEFSPVFRVARDVMAAVSLPEALAIPDEELVGGVADIGNRGPLHRLLLSELAHDDDTLAIRIALNEALYLRREPTSHQPPSSLLLLLDTGLRMWGTPRVFAVSAALAFLAKAPKDATPSVFRSKRNTVAPADLGTREGMIAQLAAFDPALHAGPSLSALAETLPATDGPRDFVIITHTATAEDRDFLDALSHFANTNIFLAALDREGRLSFRKKTGHGWRTLTEARIDLQILSAPRPSQKNDSAPGTLPAILGIHPFPFLLSPFGSFTHRCAPRHDCRAFLTDRREIWLFPDSNIGGRRPSAVPVTGTILFFGPARGGDRLVVISWRSNGSILEIHSETEDAKTMNVRLRSEVRACPLQVAVLDGVAILIFPRCAEAVSIASGALLETLELTPGMRPVGGCFLLIPELKNRWRVAALTWNGAALAIRSFDHSASSTLVAGDKTVLAFRRRGTPVPWVLSADGSIRMSGYSRPVFRAKSEGSIREAEASHFGDRLWLRDTKGVAQMLDLTDPANVVELKWLGRDKQMLENVRDPQRWSLRVHFTHIALNPFGGIILRAQKGYWLRLERADERLRFARVPELENHASEPSLRRVTFQAFPTPPESQLTMKIAAWPDGSRAFLDDRGLLHLQSSDAAIPEVSLVLAESESLPAWSSDGHILGPRYFLGERAATDGAAAIITDHLRRFAARVPR